MLFDEVLSRGFSPQVFTAGLNAHMRDLLMAKGPAISLVEFTGTLVERYKQQAARCDESFLFNAMSLLTEADGRLRQASNQRLFVELGLMKIAGLGQKKNDEALTPTFETNFPLPELTPQAAPTAAQQVAPAVAQPQPTPAVAQPQVASVAAQPQVGSATQQVAQPVSQPGAQSIQQSAPQPVAQPQQRAAVRTSTKPKLGLSINSLMGGEAKTASEEAAAAAAAVEVVVDPRSEEKLLAAKPKMIEILGSGRVRYIPVFNTMRAVGNVVHLTVASRELFEEIMRDKLRWLGEIAEVAGVNGVLELEVTINEAIKIARPITIEDRLKHLMAKNDKLKEMIEQLVLDAE